MKILFPTDFSENAQLACDTALDIVKKSQGELIVLHSYDLPYSDRSMTISLMEVMRENAQNNMAEFAETLKDKGVKYSTKVEMGNPIRLIKSMADELNIDMVVMGTKGASGLEEVLLGSNAASCIQNTDVPVLVIPPKHQLSNFGKVILATDMAFKDPTPLRDLKQFLSLYPAELEVLYIQDGGEISQEARQLLAHELEGIEYHLSILHGKNIEKEILTRAESSNVQLVSAIHRHYSFFEGLFHSSVTAKLAYHSSIPLLALQEPRS